MIAFFSTNPILRPMTPPIMPRALPLRAVRVAAAATILLGATAALAQDSQPNLLDRIFGGSDRVNQPAAPERGVPAAGPGRGQDAAELFMRVDRLEARIRELTGAIEQLQYRNQQLEAALSRLQGGAGIQGGAQQGAPGGRITAAPPEEPPRGPLARPGLPPPVAQSPAIAPPTGGRRGDAFDPAQNPNAPGAPRALGTTPPSPGAPPPQPQSFEPDDAPVGAPGGRAAGAPLDLSSMAGVAANEPAGPSGQMPPAQMPPAQEPPAAAPPARSAPQLASVPPSDSPKESFDQAYGSLARKDYALAEEGFRAFLRRFPSDRLTPDAQYWLGESLFQRQRFRDAAESFLHVSTKYETAGKAPDALLRLGQSLAAMGEKEAACASLAEVLRKYPRASVSVKQGVEREQKRVRC
jgi:tol-pal system protein YbgF